LIYGRFFIKLTSLSFKANSSLSLQFVCGYLVLNTILFLLSLFTPFAIAMNVSIVGWGGLLILLSSRGIAKDAPKPADYLPDFLCLLLSGIAATLWCTDVLRPVAAEGSLTIYQTNHDSFFHSRLISSFAQARGFKTMSIILMSDSRCPVPLRDVSHAGSNFIFITSSAYITFVSFLIPFGILLTGLAAFSLVGSVWGRWPGIAATLAVAMLPDAYQQGLGNKFLVIILFKKQPPEGCMASRVLRSPGCLSVNQSAQSSAASQDHSPTPPQSRLQAFQMKFYFARQQSCLQNGQSTISPCLYIDTFMIFPFA